MAVYAVGDVHGCAQPLEALLDRLRFDISQDQLWLTGDIVNRGPHSLRSLRLIRSLGDSAITVLGNHDLHLLAVSAKVKKTCREDTLRSILKAPDGEELIEWLRHCPLLHFDTKLKTIMVHAGIYPGWSRKNVIAYANEVEKLIRGPYYREFLMNMYSIGPVKWDKELTGWDRSKFIINALTRMRYCSKNGNLNFTQKGPPGSQPKIYIPWFQHPKLKCRKWKIVFGHWSALGFLQSANIISLDSGCVWGRKLTVVRLDGGKAGKYWQLNC